MNNIGNIWRKATADLQPSDSARLDARLLLEHLLQVNHAYLQAHQEDLLSDEKVATFRTVIARAKAGEPIPYIIGEAPFYGRFFYVSPATLIPRPETELLVEAVAKWAKDNQTNQLNIVDVGCGSGCIPISLAFLLPNASLTAIDISAEALAMAKKNQIRFNLQNRVKLQQGNLLADNQDQFNIITANLPYVTDDEWAELPDGVKWYEPSIALKGGADGLQLIDKLLAQAVDCLLPQGSIWLEIGWKQGEAAKKISAFHFPNASISIKQDYSGYDRIILIET